MREALTISVELTIKVHLLSWAPQKVEYIPKLVKLLKKSIKSILEVLKKCADSNQLTSTDTTTRITNMKNMIELTKFYFLFLIRVTVKKSKKIFSV